MVSFCGQKKRSGYLDLDRAKASEQDMSGKSNSAFIFNVTLRETKKNYLFRTQTHKERIEWIDIINKSSDQTKQLLSEWAKEDPCINCIALTAMDAPMDSGNTDDKDKDDKEEGDEAGKGSEIEKLRKLPLKDTSGNTHLFKDIIGKWDFTLIALLRHFG